MGDSDFTWQAAERLACAHMRAIGYPDARQTPPGADAGLDIVSGTAAAQVKFRSATTGRPDLQRLVGSAPRKALLFYSSSGYSATALSYAEDADVALFVYSEHGRVTPANAHGERRVAEHPGAAAPFLTGWDRSRRLQLLKRVGYLYLATSTLLSALLEIYRDPEYQRSLPTGTRQEILAVYHTIDKWYQSIGGWVSNPERGMTPLRKLLHRLDEGDLEAIQREWIAPTYQDFVKLVRLVRFDGVPTQDIMRRRSEHARHGNLKAQCVAWNSLRVDVGDWT